MVRIRETDYHHGAITTVLVNNGFNLSLFETQETRRSYNVSKGKEKYLIYSKFASNPSSTNAFKRSFTWSFSFSEEEVQKIKQYQASDSTCLIALTTHYGAADGGELAIMTVDEFLRTLGENGAVKSGRVYVVKEHRKQVRIYGTGIARASAFIATTNLLTNNL